MDEREGVRSKEKQKGNDRDGGRERVRRWRRAVGSSPDAVLSHCEKTSVGTHMRA
jgi:hypothetical protein